MTVETKPTFPGLGSRQAALIYDTLRTGLRTYLRGIDNDEGVLKNEGQRALRIGGQLLAATYELTSDDVTNLSSELHEDDVLFQSPAPRVGAFITARLAEGIYEEGQHEVAQEVVMGMTDNHYAEEATVYFDLSDRSVDRPDHI